jgi:Lrp/AsnC family transcriptional regulator for asnA, asnC and gidA
VALEHSDYLQPAVELSETDRLIVEVLQRDGRRPYSQLARDVGVTEKTVRRRVQALLDSGTIHITAVTDPRTLGYDFAALAGLRLDGTRPAAEIARDLTRVDALDYIVVAAGRHAVLAEVFCRDAAHLAEVVDAELRGASGVQDVELWPYLSLVYQQADFGVARERRLTTGVRPVEVERLDRRIIQELTRDGRMPLQTIADELAISETQVRTRLRRMTEIGAVQVIAIVNPLRYGYGTMAWLGIRARAGGRLQALAEELTRLPNVTYVAICTGSMDVWAEVVARSQHELLEMLDDEVRRIPELDHLEVFLYLDLHYKRLRPLPDALA